MKIVFDIGGTKMRVAKSVDGKALDKVVSVSTPQSYDEGLKLLVEQIQTLANGELIESVTGGVPAILNEEKSELVTAVNLHDWAGKKLKTELEHNFNCTVLLENDANLAALSEATLGSGKNYKSVMYITIGTGIGGAWVVKKQLAQKDHNFEPGHHIIDANGPICPGDGKAGHWEAYIKQPNFLDILITGLYNSFLYWPSDVIVLGGGVALNGNWNLEEIKNNLSGLLQANTETPDILLAEFGDESGLKGALLI